MANEIAEKICTKCEVTKPVSEFHKNRAAGDGLACECRGCKKAGAAARYVANKEKYDARSKAHYEANREKALERMKKRSVEKREEIAAYQREYRLRSNYGITLADFKAMDAAQNGLCYVCKNPEIRHAALVVDHNHSTGQVRKLLCTPCNTALGFAFENPAILRALAAYVEAHDQ